MEFKHTPEEARELWADALESGEYSQTRETLRDETGYCCLGVACELFAQYEGIGEWAGERKYFKVGLATSSIALPDPVADWLGVTHAEVKARVPGFFLSNLNDRGSSFEKIAKIIREKKIRLQ